MDKAIFIDIDGPIINTPMYFLDPNCSLKRSVMNTQAIAYVVKLASFSGAKIVCNTTHNTHDIEDPLTGKVTNVKEDLIYWGIPPDLFHEDWMTTYPYPEYEEYGTHRRLRAIKEWMVKNGEVDWVAFDDDNFTDSEKLILIDFDRGIDYDAFRQAIKVWGLEDKYGVVRSGIFS